MKAQTSVKAAGGCQNPCQSYNPCQKSSLSVDVDINICLSICL